MRASWIRTIGFSGFNQLAFSSALLFRGHRGVHTIFVGWCNIRNMCLKGDCLANCGPRECLCPLSQTRLIDRDQISHLMSKLQCFGSLNALTSAAAALKSLLSPEEKELLGGKNNSYPIHRSRLFLNKYFPSIYSGKGWKKWTYLTSG